MTEAEQMIEDINRRHHKLTDWEQGFMDSMNLMTDMGNLSHKQYKTLENIWERVT